MSPRRNKQRSHLDALLLFVLGLTREAQQALDLGERARETQLAANVRTTNM
jgi:hypothetical protein